MTFKAPDKLYRYRSTGTSYFEEELDRALKRREIYFPAAAYLNDPFDCSPAIDDSNTSELNKYLRASPHRKISRQVSRWESKGFAVTQETRNALKRLYKNPVRRVRLEQRLGEKFLALLRDNARVACLSMNHESIVMWSHYAQQHKGICIEYCWNDEALTRFNANFPLPVHYTRTRSSVSALDLLKEMDNSQRPETDTDPPLGRIMTALLYQNRRYGSTNKNGGSLHGLARLAMNRSYRLSRQESTSVSRLTIV